MDTSGLPSSLVLAGFLLVFAYLSLAENSLPSRGALLGRLEVTNSVALALRMLRAASILAIGLSGLALLVSQVSSPRSIWIALVSLGVLAVVVLIDRGSVFLARRYFEISLSCTKPVKHLILMVLKDSRSLEGPSNSANGRQVPGEETGKDEASEPAITEEEQVGLDTRERSMLRSILRLDDVTVREVMVPRVDIAAAEITSSLTEVAQRMVERGHSRLPVYGENLDTVEGVVHARDLLSVLASEKEPLPLKDIIRPAFFIPESKRLDDLLEELQEKHLQMAIVVDEYGGTEGLVTLEDLLEEIVGEIEDEFSSRSPEPYMVPLGDGDLLVDAGVTLEYIGDLMSIPVDGSGVDTIGAFVYSTLGKIPEMGDQVMLDGLRVEVVSLLGRRIRRLRITKMPS